MKRPGATDAEATRAMGKFLRDVMKLNLESKNFRLFSPDENNSNRWQDAMEVTNRAWMAEKFPYDDHLSPDGRVMEILSEHPCQGWLEGYLLTGRHGFSLPTRHSYTLSIPCLISMQNGLKSLVLASPGEDQSLHLTIFCPRMYGGRIIMVLAIRILDS